MQTEFLRIYPASPGQQYQLQVLRFGVADAPQKVYIQAALHADEVPALLVAQELKRLFVQLEAAGQLLGQVVLVPYANPIGLSQHMLTQHQGRFDLQDGVNFNRAYPDLTASVATAVTGGLGADSRANTRLIREALREAAAAQPARTTAQGLKKQLLQLAVDADIVLDLHCDNEAVMHVYALSEQVALAQQLAARLGAQALLLASHSGDAPFDEACSRPWLQLQQQFADTPIDLACFCATVELRGEADVSHAQARQDAQAIVEFLRDQGIVVGPLSDPPAALCEATPLAASEPIVAPTAGVVVFRAEVGDRVSAGAVIADLVDVDTGVATPLHCQSAGTLYARCATRWAYPGKNLAKIAGTSLVRTGKLLNP